MLLSGYGVELAIKSTEYKAVDDTKVKGQMVIKYSGPCCVQGNKTLIFCFFFVDSKTALNPEEDDNDDVQGFFFGKLQ